MRRESGHRGHFGAGLQGVSCAPGGTCTAIDDYDTTSASGKIPFAITGKNGVWGQKQPLPGLAAFAGQSCPAPGDSVVTGYYATDTPAGAVASRPFAAVEADGTWQAAAQVILPALSPDGTATANSLSCPAVGKCVIAGAYQPAVTASPSTGFVVTQTPAGWSAPVTFPGVAIDAISCPSAGNCAATAQDDTANVADVINEVHGTWGKVSPLPGVTGLSYNGEKATVSEIFNLVCPSARNCTAAGIYYTDLSASPPAQNVFLASEVGGKWRAARVPAGLLALNTAGYASVAGLDCAAAANCVVGGDYDSTAGQGAFLLAEVPRPG